MSRNLIVGILSLGLMGFGLFSVLSAQGLQDRVLDARCETFLGQPAPGWVSLKGCLLDMESLVLESEAGDFETLENRRQGLSQKPLVDPKWVVAWAPLRPELGRQGVIRAVYRVDSADLLKWINTFDRAGEREKERMWVDPAMLRRMAKPAVIEGRAEKPVTDSVQRAFGTTASVTMLVVTPGKPPKTSIVQPIVGVSLIALLALTILAMTRKPKAGVAEPSAQHIANIGVSDVKLEYGALEDIRAEERAEKRKKKGG